MMYPGLRKEENSQHRPPTADVQASAVARTSANPTTVGYYRESGTQSRLCATRRYCAWPTHSAEAEHRAGQRGVEP